MNEILLMIVGGIITLFCVVILLALGINHAIDEAERTKDLLTEGDLFNYYRDKND